MAVKLNNKLNNVVIQTQCNWPSSAKEGKTNLTTSLKYGTFYIDSFTIGIFLHKKNNGRRELRRHLIVNLINFLKIR